MITTKRDRRLDNWRVSFVVGGEAIKGKESGKVEEQVKGSTVGDGY